MIYKVEVAKSNLSICNWCNKPINKLEIRGIDCGSFICSKCLDFGRIIEDLIEIEEEFIKLSKLSNEEREGMLTKQKVINKLR